MRAVTWPSPRTVLAAFCVLLLVEAALHRGHSVESMDVRTYVQMMHGVAEHGAPSWDNGPLDRWPLVVPHAAPARGLVWGIYSPLYPYLFAPILRAFSLGGVSSATFALLVPIVITTFALARRFSKSEWYALGAAILVVVSTPLAGKSLEMTAFPLATLMATLGTYFGVQAVGGKAPRRNGVLAGLSWAAAMAAHVLTFPMAITSLVVIGLAPDPADGRRSLRGFAPAIAAFVLGVAPVGILNHVRFDSWNPVSYGPAPWCGPAEMNVASQLTYGMPVGAFAIVACAGLWLARKRRFAWIAVLAGALLAAWFEPTLHERGLRYLRLAFGYVVDLGVFDLNPWIYGREKDGFGLFIGDRVNKATLQATPIVALAAVAGRAVPSEKRWPLIALLMPTVALYASFLTRANMELTNAFGFPWVHHRYTLAAMPALLTGAFVVLERIRMPRAMFIAASVLGPLLAAYFWLVSDHALVKRLLLLALTLVASFGAVVAALSSLRKEHDTTRRRLAHVLALVAIVLGIGIGIGHDFRAHYETKRWSDDRVDRFVAAVPARFALLGTLGEFEALLTTTATHDVRYAELARFPGWGHDLRGLIDYWRAEGREVFLQARSLPVSPWPDVKLVPMENVPDVLHLEFVNVVPAPP